MRHTLGLLVWFDYKPCSHVQLVTKAHLVYRAAVVGGIL